MNPTEMTMSVAALANAIANCLDDDALDIAATIFSLLGSTLGAIAVSRGKCDPDGSDGADDGLLAQ